MSVARQKAPGQFAAQHGIPAVYRDIEELLGSRDRPDLLIVAGPDDMHPAASTAAIDAGVAVFCEKPLANSVDVAATMARHAEGRKVPNTVGYSFRYSPAIQALRADLRAGRLGDPWFMEITEYNAQFHPRLGKALNWKGDPERATAGALFEYGSHAIDLADWLVGPIGAVSTSLARVLPGARLDDIATLQFRGRTPVTGVLVASWVLAGSIPGIRVRLHGSEGLVEVELSQTLSAAEAYRRYGLDGTLKEEVPLEPLGEPGSSYARRHLADFIATIRRDEAQAVDTLPSFHDGARIQEILRTALAATERWTDVGADLPQPSGSQS